MAKTATERVTLPGDRTPSRTLRFAAPGGVSLYGEYFDAPNPRGVALIVHGYAEHCARYRELANVVSSEGLATLSFDLRGHGRAEGPRGHIDRIEDYLDDFDAALRKLDELSGAGDLPRLVVGHSNGSLIALRALADPSRRPARVAGAILSSPFLGFKIAVNPVKKLAGRLVSHIVPKLAMPNELRAIDLTHDEGKLRERDVDTYCHGVATARWYTETVAAQAWVLANAARVEVPTLWLVAGADKIADPAASRAVHARLSAPAIYREMPEMYHEVFNETDRGALFHLVRGFIAERFG